MNPFPHLATDRYRWVALVFIALGLAIVIIDNTVLNVAVPHILRDFNTSFDAIQWVISGYALIIATVLITVGRIGDIIGRRKMFILGTIFFAIGSFIASISQNPFQLFIGEALIEAFGAAMMLTASLSLLVSEFHGKERAIAFGIWGSVAGASGTIGPLLGGYFTAYHSWRWSFRINVFVALIAIVGTIFIKESFGEKENKFDWWGTVLSGIGLFSLVFGFIEGQNFGWWSPNKAFVIGNWIWSFWHVSIIPFAFAAGIIFLILFSLNEINLERKGKSPLLKLSTFKNRGFSSGMATLLIVSLGQFGVFFILPIYLQVVLGLNAFQAGVIFIPASVTIMIAGPLSGFISSRIGPKWMVSGGMFILAIGTFMLAQAFIPGVNGWNLAPALIIFGIGIGFTSAQLTNIILSSVPIQLAGEASAANNVMRQVGTSIGIAILGVVLASHVTTTVSYNINADWNIPNFAKDPILTKVQNIDFESGQENFSSQKGTPAKIINAVKSDITDGIDSASQITMAVAFIFIIIGASVSLLIPNTKQHLPWENNSDNTDQTPKSFDEFQKNEEIVLKENR